MNALNDAELDEVSGGFEPLSIPPPTPYRPPGLNPELIWVFGNSRTQNLSPQHISN